MMNTKKVKGGVDLYFAYVHEPILETCIRLEYHPAAAREIKERVYPYLIMSGEDRTLYWKNGSESAYLYLF